MLKQQSLQTFKILNNLKISQLWIAGKHAKIIKFNKVMGVFKSLEQSMFHSVEQI